MNTNMNPSMNPTGFQDQAPAEYQRAPARKLFARWAREYVAAMDNYSAAIKSADEAPDDMQRSLALARTNKHGANAYRGLIRCASEVLKEQGAMQGATA